MLKKYNNRQLTKYMILGILKIGLVMLILVGMVVILLSISHLMSGRFDSTPEEAAELRRDIRRDEKIMTRYNLFRSFISNGSDVRQRKGR